MAINVTFTKNPNIDFDPQVDTEEGKIYFRKNGIFVDGDQYSTKKSATQTSEGTVKLSDSSFEISEDSGIIAPTEEGVAATPQLVYNTLVTAKAYTDNKVANIPKPSIEQHDKTVNKITKDYIISDDFAIDENNKIYVDWFEIT